MDKDKKEDFIIKKTNQENLLLMIYNYSTLRLAQNAFNKFRKSLDPGDRITLIYKDEYKESPIYYCEYKENVKKDKIC